VGSYATPNIQPATQSKSFKLIPMPSALEEVLRNYIQRIWKPNTSGILFPSKKDGGPHTRKNVVVNELKPVLRKLGIPSENTGLPAFRHGLAIELVENSVPVTVLQSQLRHADVRTSLKVYAHLIPQSQRDAMENIGGVQSLRSTNTLLELATK
jgi:integrase